jgi:hypothetical protein
MFQDGGLFLPEAVDTVTQKSIRVLKKLGVVRYSVGHGNARREIAAVVPAQQTPEIAARAKLVFQTFRAFFDANFPLHEVANAYCCFDLEAQLSLAQRGELLRSLAIHEGINGDEAWPPSCTALCLSCRTAMRP